VVGVSHATLGEVPCLFVVSKEDGLDVASLMELCRVHLSSYKIPEAVHPVEEIPRTGSGKIMRYKLVAALSRNSVRDGAAMQIDQHPRQVTERSPKL
jgi:acyl-CoA synthetase (AMP-forming)/AMP-acid ligase II